MPRVSGDSKRKNRVLTWDATLVSSMKGYENRGIFSVEMLCRAGETANLVIKYYCLQGEEKNSPSLPEGATDHSFEFVNGLCFETISFPIQKMDITTVGEDREKGTMMVIRKR